MVLEVFLGSSLEFHNECFFVLAFPHDASLVQLHALVLTLSAALVADDFRTRGHLASVLCFFSLPELPTDWLSEDVGAQEGAAPLARVLVSAASASSALLKLFVLILREAVSLFFTPHLVCRQAVLALLLDSAWSQALKVFFAFSSFVVPGGLFFSVFVGSFG